MTYSLGKLKIQYLKKFKYYILSLISLINFEYKYWVPPGLV